MLEDLEKLKTAAEQGNADAQWKLGLMCHGGDGVSQDFAEAVYWYRKAAEQGYAEAQWLLGYMYDEGEGVTPNLAEAIKWCSKAAEQGHEGAKFDLAVMTGAELVCALPHDDGGKD
jgi:uncharacterized protein